MSNAYIVDFNSGAVGFTDKASIELSVLAVRGRSSISTGAFKFFGIPEKVTANTPFPLELIAEDSAFNGTVKLNIQAGGGVNPQSVTLENGLWKGDIAITQSGKTRLIASYSPLNGGYLFGSSGWFDVAADQSVNADLEVMIIEDKAVYSVGDIIGYSIYVNNKGKDAAPNVTIDLAFTAGVDVRAVNCAGAYDSSCENVVIGNPASKFKANILLGQLVKILSYVEAQSGCNSIKLTAEAHDSLVHDPLETNNKALSVITTDIPNLNGSHKAELRILPGSSNSAAADTVVLTHGLQDLPCDAEELWTDSKSEPTQAGYLIQQAMEKAGETCQYLSVFLARGMSKHYWGILLDASYQGGWLNINAAAQHLAVRPRMIIYQKGAGLCSELGNGSAVFYQNINSPVCHHEHHSA